MPPSSWRTTGSCVDFRSFSGFRRWQGREALPQRGRQVENLPGVGWIRLPLQARAHEESRATPASVARPVNSTGPNYSFSFFFRSQPASTVVPPEPSSFCGVYSIFTLAKFKLTWSIGESPPLLAPV